MGSLEENIRIHNRIASRYANVHGEIFNDVEQGRLRRALFRALDHIATNSDRVEALDLGCGTGNVTHHLTSRPRVHVVAADVSTEFLRLIADKCPAERVRTHSLNGKDLSEFEDESFDFAAVYSVLHHIPDYLLAVREMVRVLKPGGVLYLDHEPPESFWKPNAAYDEYVRTARRFEVRKFFVLDNYIGKVKRFFNPRYTNEGDIHVWPDDHIEWRRIEEVLLSGGMEVLWSDEYLLCREGFRRNVYVQHQDHLVDTKLMVARKTP